jgi:hypothetical protein
MKRKKFNEKLKGNSWADYIQWEMIHQPAISKFLPAILPIISERREMRKYTFLRFGRCYTNKEGDIKVLLVTGNREVGYVGLFDCRHPAVASHKIYLKSRVVLNNGSWTEVDKSCVSIASILTYNYGN